MADSEETAVCGHCNKDVAKGNLPMHEVHCKRFLTLCTVCDEMVPKDQLDVHLEEQHTPVRCKMCNMKMERYKLPDHETNECTERIQTCEFCKLDLPLSSLKDHTVTCGSRTERCPDCNQYVVLKDRRKHALTCDYNLYKDSDSTNEESLYEFMNRVDKLQDNKNQDKDVDQSQDTDDTHSSASDQNFSLSALQKKKSDTFGRPDVDEINTCQHCHLALPLATLQWHENKCKIFETLKLLN